MPTITLLKYTTLGNVWRVAEQLDNKKFESGWMTAMVSKYNRNEVFASYWHYEDVEDGVKRVFSEDDADEIVKYLKQNGKTKVLKRTYCFINTLTRTFEIYRGPDMKTGEIITSVEKILNVKFEKVVLKAEQLQKIYSNHATELTQVMFKNIQGLIYEILRGKYLENNEKYHEYLKNFYQSLRVISFRPKIKFLNGNNKYQVTLNGDKGTIRISSNGDFTWRPRYEIRQIIFMIAATAGLLPS